jgi:1,4-dihydroxy-2-naphthoate polyprenyltransferase
MRLYVVLLVLAYALLPLLVRFGLPVAAALAVVALCPLAGVQLWRVHRGDWHDPTRWDALGFYTIALLLATAAVELGVFVMLVM